MTTNSLKYLLICTVLALIAATPNRGSAQTTSKDDVNYITKSEIENPKTGWLTGREAGIHEFSILGGYAFDSFELWGKTPNATLGQLAFGYNRKFLRLGEQVVEYRVELNIFSKITYPEFSPSEERASLSGFGLAPLGFRINFRQSKPVQPFLGTSAGFMYLDGPFPDERGKKFNFTLRTGGGVEFMVHARYSLSFGYTYYHLSNGDNGQVNPGIDSGFLFASFTVF